MPNADEARTEFKAVAQRDLWEIDYSKCARIDYKKNNKNTAVRALGRLHEDPISCCVTAIRASRYHTKSIPDVRLFIYLLYWALRYSGMHLALGRYW